MVWDSTTGRENPHIDGRRFSRQKASSSDGKLVAENVGRRLTVREVVTGREVRSFEGYASHLRSIAFSPNGKRIVTTDFAGSLHVWNVTTGQEIFTKPSGWGRAVFSPDGKRVLAGGTQGPLYILDATSGEELQVIRGGIYDGVRSFDFSPDGTRVATGTAYGMLEIWDASKGQESLSLDSQTPGGVMSIAFSPDGKQIASTTNVSSTLTLWDATSGRKIRSFEDRLGCNFSPDGKRICGADTKGKVGAAKVWDATTGREILTLKGFWAKAFSPDGNRIIGMSEGQAPPGMCISLWDATTGRETLHVPAWLGELLCSPFSPDGSRFVSMDLSVWDATTGDRLLALTGHTGTVFCYAFSPDGKRIAGAAQALDERGHLLAGEVKVWDAMTGELQYTVKSQPVKQISGGPFAIAFSPDGSRLVKSSEDGMLTVYEATTGQELLIFKAHTSAMWSIAFSPDGKRIVGGGSDGTIKVWEATAERQ
jgi:WD40 repeat protein